MVGDEPHDFGSGYELESGDYPVPGTAMPIEEDKSELSGSLTNSVNYRNLEYVDVSGLILDHVPWRPPYQYEKEGKEPPIKLTTVFIGKAGFWYRVNFWGDIGAEVSQALSQTDPVSLRARGHGNYTGDVRDVHVLDGDDESDWEFLSEPVNYEPKSASHTVAPSEIERDSGVPMSIGDVMSKTGEVTRDGNDEEFQTNHLAMHSAGEYLLASLYNYHADQSISPHDTVGIYSGGGPKIPLDFVPDKLPSIEYEGEVAAFSFSGLCNFSQHEHIDID